MKSILEVEGVIKFIGGRQVLSDCYIRCETGEIVGMLGNNGAGKSLLLKIIFGLVPAYNKSIRIDNVPYKFPYTNNGLIGYLPQHHFLPRNLTVVNIVNSFIENESNRASILERPEVKDNQMKKIGMLSGGELRFLELLLLLNLDVRFVLLDEPYVGIEPIHKHRIEGLLNEHRLSKGIIITDHDFESVVRVSDRIILIVNGVCKIIKSLSELEDWGYIPSSFFKDKL